MHLKKDFEGLNMKLHLTKNNKGDTIVEVMLCIAIVAAVITGAYALASHSLQEGVAASEHGEAIKLAQGQVEALKFRHKASRPATWDTYFTKPTGANKAQNFCLDTTAATETNAAGIVQANWKPQINGTATFDPTKLQTGAANYLDNAAHTQCVQGNGKYFINITIPAAASPSPTYLVTVRWNPAGGEVQSQTQLFYRF
jgi:Tfp pilus assembly protein PilV